jgi:hypothetical protein
VLTVDYQQAIHIENNKVQVSNQDSGECQAKPVRFLVISHHAQCVYFYTIHKTLKVVLPVPI